MATIDPQTSFSQLGEDILVSAYLKTGEVRYLDVGCYHPIFINNTYKLYLSGGNGICIDPNPELIPLYQRHRPKDEFISGAISVDGKKETTYYRMTAETLNTTSLEEAEVLMQKNQVRWFGKQEILEKKVVPAFDINELLERSRAQVLNVDIEGNDLAVLERIDWSRYRPRVVIAETRQYFPDTDEYINDFSNPITNLMLGCNYRVIGLTFLNTIYADKRVPQ